MRALLPFLALFLLAAAPARDWTAVARQTPAGAYVVGNPAARVKLVEYFSYTCPHCAAFSAESAPVLTARMIRSGSTSVEYRHFIFSPLDLAAAMLARCTGPRGFAATTEHLFERQGEWVTRGSDWLGANGQRVALYPRLGQLRAIADGAGLTEMVRARGLPPAAVDRCFADAGEVDRILKMTQDAPVRSTPSFFLNGKPLPPTTTWATLQPLLRAAGAR